MEIVETGIEGLLIVKPQVFGDARGFFFETYNEKRYKNAGIDYKFVQDNISSSQYGVVRGLHFQKPPYSQTKLVQVIEGSVLDVAVDLRSGSSTYGKWFSVELTSENHWQFLIPRGFAHGFSVLSEKAMFTYKCDNLYNPSSEGGVRFDDPTLNIDWRIDLNKAITSDKDKKHPFFNELDKIF
ncbi:MAG: dTDP-4-dehydrorhamnose 3,5-epimerase [Paludibacteraceae bacterium]|nr:dTDP-4-dehydrorhamnose 3,5-epimerase [Paludibacteraceae bacterium]